MSWADIAKEGHQKSLARRSISQKISELPVDAREQIDRGKYDRKLDATPWLQLCQFYRIFGGIYIFIGWDPRGNLVWSDGADHLHGMVMSSSPFDLKEKDQVDPNDVPHTRDGRIIQDGPHLYGMHDCSQDKYII